jgi:hypothetical protein
MALLLSAQTGEAFTAAQLLGEGEEEQTARLIEAESDAEALIEKMKRSGIA